MSQQSLASIELEANKASTRHNLRKFARRFWEGWKRVGRKIGDFQSRLILSLFYFVILFPFALVVRLKADPLGIKKGAARGWHQRAEDGSQPLDKASRQF